MAKLALPGTWGKLFFPKDGEFILPEDTPIAPLCYALNAVGMETIECCGGHLPDTSPRVVISRLGKSIESRVIEAIQSSGFLWEIKEINGFPMGWLHPRADQRQLHKADEYVLYMQLESIDLAIYLLTSFGMRDSESEAIKRMKDFKEQLRHENPDLTAAVIAAGYNK